MKKPTVKQLAAFKALAKKYGYTVVKKAASKKKVEPFVLPMGISLFHLKEAVNGNAYSLNSAFNWGDTPQGSCYWVDICDGEKPFTAEAKSYCKRVLKEYLKQNPEAK